MIKFTRLCSRQGLVLLGVLLLAGCARSDALWGVVDKLCMVNYQHQQDPAPCQQVYMPPGQGKEQGFSVIQNPRYPYHFILVPTTPLSGIESPQLLLDGRTDYFGYAWLMRHRLTSEYGQPVPDERLGMAINSAYGRSQNQLHIHLTCLREDVYRQLQAERPYIQETWSALPDKLLRHTYYARRVVQPTAMGIYPIRSVAEHFHLSPSQLAEYGVALVPTEFSGQTGFILLTTKRGWDSGNRASVESLLDKTCAILALNHPAE
ncbi:MULTISPECIES: CDP-diacylglycerol diphosphatase [unclassified Serratia (in: enterobacteria)]|uniref:CDP-diacylglycerol pyrophosphatase n=1 Tax=unclassified Serratia (in: enterobacteria) TaxID=2647522 RepID=UPI00050354CE|nr:MULTISPECIES: CDP-diacylglycerol diphosphatase [unclassified Serratia (in: enterobacteria)]KFK95069.1 cytochrome C551 [Serratia sp. Ag2]KFK96244.1 cytochrome C551 [Serratia sp. Ag1]